MSSKVDMPSKAVRVNLRNKKNNKEMATMEKNLRKKLLNSLEKIGDNSENKKKAAQCFSSYISRVAKNAQKGQTNGKKAARIQQRAARKYKNAVLKQAK
jgi:ribosomal protein S20